jgi:hypothetical protein
MKQIKLILTLIIALALLAIPVSADIQITVQNSSQNYITWSWPAGMGITNESIDGVTVCGFDSYATSFTLSGLNPGEQHTIVLYNATDSGTNTATTGPDTSVYADITGTINAWIYVILIIVFFIFGMSIRWGWLLYILGSCISLYALADWMQTNSIQITDIWHLQFYLYIGLFLMGIVLWIFARRK